MVLSQAPHSVQICHDRRDWRSCKIGASFVIFSRKQRTHQVWFYTETFEILHTQLNSNKKGTKISDINEFTLFIFSKIVAMHALLVCKIFGLKIGPCKFFDKSQVFCCCNQRSP